MAIIQEIGSAIEKTLGIEDETQWDFRPPVEEQSTAADTEAVDLAPIRPEQTVSSPELGEEFGASVYAVPDFGPIDFGIDDDAFSISSAAGQLRDRIEQGLDSAALLMSEQGTLSAPADADSAKDEYMKMLQQMENGGKEGWKVTGRGSAKFFPFESVEGKGPDGDIFSKFEIGYGNKIPNSWLEDDETKWPTIQGVPINVREGLNDKQARALMKHSLDSAERVASKRVPNFKDMSVWEQQYWVDLTYNGGHGVARKNPKAIKAAKAGYTAESLIRTFDFVGAGGKKMRGLMNRRLNMFNQASMEDSGLPSVSEYSWGPDGIKVKFSSKITTEKVSKRMRDRINKADGWYKVAGAPKDATEQKSYKVDGDYQFN